VKAFISSLMLIVALLPVTSPAADAVSPSTPATATRSLGRVFEKLKSGQETTIVYFGGSITAAAGYRVKTFKWFADRFPKARAVHAAIGGTGSDLGAFRCAADVIAEKPDLVFVEFSINDSSPTNEFRKATMEGIVRQLWASETRPEIVFLYTTSRALNHPRVSHPAVARYYGIPEIDLQPPLVAALQRADLPKPTEKQLADPKLDWKTPGQIFMNDSVHPNDFGHTIYADTIEAYLTTQLDAPPSSVPALGKPLVSDEFARVKMIAPGTAALSGNWESLPGDSKNSLLKRYRLGTINARNPGDSLEFPFEGTAVGLFLNVQKDGGRFEWAIDDGISQAPDKSYGGPKGVKHGTGETAPQQYFPRNNFAMLSCGLRPGKHTLKIKVLPEHDATSTGKRLLIGYFLVGGLP
jgi:lysophospholipase L1-like esterase